MRKEEAFRDYETKEVKVIGLYFGYEKDEVLALEAEWALTERHFQQCRRSIDILRKYNPEKVSKGSAAVVAK